MGRRPIIIPRHPSILAKQQSNEVAREPILRADSLAHPLALEEIRDGRLREENQNNQNNNNTSFESSSSSSSTSCSGGCVGSIGIRRHGQNPQFSTPETKKRTRMIRKRSPTSILLPLDFIEEEGEEEEDHHHHQQQQQQQQQHSQTTFPPSTDSVLVGKPESVMTERAVISLSEDDDGRLSDLFLDDSSLFGSAIEHVDESHDFGHKLILPMDAEGLVPDGFQDQTSRQDLHSMTALDQQQEEEDRMASFLATSAGSSIVTTSTLERSLETKRQTHFRGAPLTKTKTKSNKWSASTNTTGKRETAFQRLLKTATQCHQKNSESRNKTSKSNHNHNSDKENHSINLRKPIQPTTNKNNATPSLVLPEEQRKTVLARYRYNQIIHTNNAKPTKQKRGHPEGSHRNNKTDPISRRLFDDDHAVEAQTKENHDESLLSRSSPDDSFATIDQELQSLRDFTLRSNASFRQAESCLSSDLHESETLVKVLEEELLAAQEQRELCLERYELAKEKRQKEKELTAIRTLHLEILSCSGKNDRSRSMLLERYEHERTSSSSSLFGEGGILGTWFLQTPQEGQTTGDRNFCPILSRRERNLREEGASKEADPTNDSNASGRNAGCGIFEDPYVHKSIEELRLIKNRLEAIKDLFDKARYMVSEEFASSFSHSDRIRKQHQSQVMIETAVSKYILFRSKNLV